MQGMHKTTTGITGRRTDSRQMSWLYLFMGGFILGTLAMNIWKADFMSDMELLGAASISRLKYLKVDNGALLVYVLKERLGVLAVLGLLAATGVGGIAAALYAAWMGMTAGLFLSVSVIRYGLKGILLILAGILPQCLLLIPAYLMFMSWCFGDGRKLYHLRKDYGQLLNKGGGYYAGKLIRLLVIIGVVIIGSIIESYVNPILLNMVLKIF